MKLLIIRFSSIGDIVLTTPVLRCLKKQRPDIEIHFLTKASFRQIVEHNPYVDKFYYLNDDLPEIIEQLKAEQYHEIIDIITLEPYVLSEPCRFLPLHLESSIFKNGCW